MRKPPQLKLYVEGGGDSEALHTELRQGFATLLRNAGVRRQPRIVACGGRGQTLDDFKSAVEGKRGEERAFLLVDSEIGVDVGDSVWDHLRKQAGWERPAGAEEGSAHLMVQCMETWFIADLDTLEVFFHPTFNRKPVPDWPDLEAVPKQRLFGTLAAATRKGKAYTKGKMSFEILGKLKAERVEAGCPAAEAFFKAMRAL